MPTKWNKELKTGDITRLEIYVNEKDSFQATNINVFTNYVLSFFNAEVINKWLSHCNMAFYQNQLNFVVWCASTGCGVSVEHLNAGDKLLSSVFRFHLYFQTRKLLQEMSCPIPGNPVFCPTDNNINMLQYQKLCNEFGVNPGTDFRFKGGENGGLGTMYNYWSRNGYHPLKGAVYNPNRYQFIENSTNEVSKIDYIKQDAAIEGWKQFILEKSRGFTKAGMVRIDESIRAYVYCILGSQAQTRSNILTSAETQQNFVDLLEQSIKSLFSIPESIEKYQNAISNTNCRVDFVVGTGLYMIPADMVLKVGSLEKYNNNIVIASNDMEIGQINDLNIITVPTSVHSPKDTQSFVDPHIQPQDLLNPVYIGMGASICVFLMFYIFS